MEAIFQLCKNIQKLDMDEVFTEMFTRNTDLKELVLDLNRWKQLHEFGVDSLGRPLGSYAMYTISKRAALGLQTEHVDLNETGRFYDSFNLLVRKGEIEIQADVMKGADDLTEQYGGVNTILGLTDESKSQLAEEMLYSGLSNVVLEKISY